MIKNLLNLFFPEVCEACNNVLTDNESIICISCRHQLPITDFHLDDSEIVKKILYGRVKLENATALLHFSKKGIVQQILHNLKYRGHQRISGVFGKWLGGELKTMESYRDVDVVVPVPLDRVLPRHADVMRLQKRIARHENYVTRYILLGKSSSILRASRRRRRPLFVVVVLNAPLLRPSFQ